LSNNKVQIATFVNTRIEEVVLSYVPIRNIGVETYPAICIKVVRNGPRLITEICCVCEFHCRLERSIYVKLSCFRIVFYIIPFGNIVKFGDDHPVKLAVIDTMKTNSIEMVVNIYIGKVS
jgi:hypothetical protein